MKTWNGDLGHLNKEEMEMFKFFYKQFKFGIYSIGGFEPIKDYMTKKAIKNTVKEWKGNGWPLKTVEICEFMLYERMERLKAEKIKAEKKLYKKLKRKFNA